MLATATLRFVARTCGLSQFFDDALMSQHHRRWDSTTAPVVHALLESRGFVETKQFTELRIASGDIDDAG